MIEPPSKELLNRLFDNRLCRRSDLRRCRKRVRKLVRDLPAFDSVWIDALQQLGKVTPFQAQVLQSQHPEQISLGPYVLLNRLGSSQASRTHLVRPRETSKQSAMKVMELPPEFLDGGLDRLNEFIARCNDLVHRSIAVPYSALRHDNRLVIVSPYIDGPNLSELMIRRGRFPAEDVTAILGQLLDGLANLESRECVHGDIRLTNVRLTAGGTAVLVDAGITPSVSPELIINARTRPERYDGIAPELIGTGASQNSQSEMYALGCLLWQLLAVRPPYSTGDPLAKLALHQTRRLVDVREWAPDTPAKLSELIFELTQPDPADRPVSFAELREKHGNSGRSSRRRLAQFHASLHTQVRTRRSTGRVMWWSTVATLLFVLSGLAVTLVDKGLRNQLLQITAPMTNYLDETLDRYRSDSPPSENPDIQTTLKKATSIVSNALPIPPPNAQGEITLTTNGPYRWDSRIDAVGSIVVKASAGKSPVIFVAPGKCRIFADQVRLENVHFQLLESETQSPAFILVNARNLSISQCSFQPRSFAEKKPQTAIDKHAASVIFWTPHSTNTRNGERLSLKDTISRGLLDFLALGAAPKQIIANNCLQLGGGRLLRFIKPARAGRNCNIRLEHTTLRDAASLLRLDTGNGRTAAGTIELYVANCVFDFDSQKGAMFHLSGNLNAFRDPLIRISGVGSVSQPNFKIAKKIGLSGTVSQMSNTDQWVLFEGGILTAPFRFSGPANGQPTSSLVNVQGIPRRSTGGPGINAKPLTLK